MTTRADLIAAARARLGTPYRRAGAQAFGANCLGLWALVLKDLGEGELADLAERHAQQGAPSAPRALFAAMKRHLEQRPVQAARPGDVLLFRDIEGGMKHLGLLTEPGIVLHGDPRAGRAIEQGLPIAGLRAVAAFRLPGLAD